MVPTSVPLLLATSFVAIIVSCTPLNFGSNNQQSSRTLIVGSREVGDSQQYQEQIYKDAKSLPRIPFEKNFRLPPHFTITQVVAEDRSRNGKGGFANIKKGGPGFSNVVITFNRQPDEGLHFLVSLFAKRTS